MIININQNFSRIQSLIIFLIGHNVSFSRSGEEDLIERLDGIVSLPQEWYKISDFAFKHQEKEIGDTESTTALEETVLTSDIKDELKDDPESMMPPKKTLHDILKDSRRRIMKVSKMYKCIPTISNTR